jgi:hypothetical protein
MLANKHISDLIGALAAIFIIPIAFIAGDYVMRLRTELASREEIAHQIGSDCCILSMGATGAIYIDPYVRSVPGLSSDLTLALLIAFLCILRYSCLHNPKGTKERSTKVSITVGLSSIILVAAVLVVGFIFGTA